MKSKFITVLCAVLIIVTAVSLGSCGKKNDNPPTEPEPPQAEETPQDDNIQDPAPEVVYTEQFRFSEKDSDAYMSLKLTETEACFEVFSHCTAPSYETKHTCAKASYTTDDNGNYIIDWGKASLEGEVFGLSVGTVGYETANTPLLLYKCSGIPMYVGDDICLMKLGVTTEKFIFLGEFNEYIKQNKDFSKQTNFYFYYVDGNTGESEYVSVSMDDVIMPDTSIVGDSVIKINYDGKQHEVACHIVAEETDLPFMALYNQYGSLYANYSQSAPAAIVRGTTYEEFFSTYTGTDPMFYCRTYDDTQGRYINVPVTDYTVEDWDTSSVAGGEEMFFRVTAEINGVTYRHVGSVLVVEEDELSYGSINSRNLQGLGVQGDDHLYFVAKGTALDNVTAELQPYAGGDCFTANITVSGYQADRVGAQLVTLTSDRAANTFRVVVYVYEPESPILIGAELPSEVTFTSNRINFTATKFSLLYSDGSRQEHTMSEYRDLFNYTINGIYHNLKFNPITSTVDGKDYYIRSGDSKYFWQD